jgi:tetratricopeptide (TPR) repeat protein
LEVGDTFAMVSQNHEAIGRYREAFRTADEGYRRTVDRMPAPALHCVSWRALARFRLGDWDGVLDDVAEAERLLGDRSETPPYFTLQGFASASFVHHSRGSVGPADRLRTILAGLLEAGRPSQGAMADMVLIEARRGDFASSRRYLEHPIWTGTYQVARHLLYRNRCLVLVWEEAWDEVPAFLAEARAHAEAAGLKALPVYLDRLEGRAAWAAGDADRAVSLLERSRAACAELEAPWEAAIAALWLSEALIQRGERREADGHLGAARAVFERLGSMPELDQAGALQQSLG